MRENIGSNIALRHGYGTVAYLHQHEFRNLSIVNDLRIHYLGNSDWGTNIGIGIQANGYNYDLGFNLFYDTFIADNLYQQFGIGGEVLNFWGDFRYNFYLPVGRKAYDINSHIFNYSGGYIMTCDEKEASMYGMDIEFGKQFILLNPNFRIYSAIGAYQYLREQNTLFIGVRTRLEGTFWNFIKAGIVATQDSVYHFSFEGFLSMSFQFSTKGISKIQNGAQWIPPIYRQELIVREKYCDGWKTNY